MPRSARRSSPLTSCAKCARQSRFFGFLFITAMRISYIHDEHNGVTKNVKALSQGTMVTTEMVQEEGRKESCACGDIFDEQLQRCFMMTPEIVLWFGGYSEKSGKFVSDLAIRLKGIVNPEQDFRNAHCSLPVGRSVESFARYSYAWTEANLVQEIYSTCEVISPAISQCLLRERKFFDPARKRMKGEGEGGEKTFFLPTRIGVSPLKLRYAFVRILLL